VAQTARADGRSFLNGVIAGYEISTRIGEAMGRAHYRYWHNTGTVGTFGAAAAAARIFALDEERFAHALAIAATFAAGLQQAFRSDSLSKPLHAGKAAENGLLAAMAAREGVTGTLDMLEGEAGLGRAMSVSPDWQSPMATLGRDFHITHITFKNHACCGHTFAAIDGALEAQRRLNVAAGNIARLRIETYRTALDVAGIGNPQTAAEARFSLAYVVATALIHGSVRLAAFEPVRLADPATRDLMTRIEIGVDEKIDAAFPGSRAALVTIETKDGRHEQVLQPTRKGDPELPLSDAELEEKYLELAAPVLGRPKAAALLQRLWALESQPSVDLI
jgi:2-methylcitrate dehydratase PrpD